MKTSISNETQQQALSMAKATQKPGQTKEQTKLIAAGIEKGIAEFKKQQKSKAREKDKLRKQQLKQKQQADVQRDDANSYDAEHIPATQFTPLAKGLLLALIGSWIAFFVLYAQ